MHDEIMNIPADIEPIVPQEMVLNIVREPVVEDDDAPDIDWDAHMFDMAIRQK